MEFDESFFLQEERNGYTVEPEMKKIWAVELDLLNKLSEVCNKHGIKFHAVYGTMLGAVRHGGFIPWDDDVDVTMLRSDYDKLCSIAKDEFDDPYFFQTHYTDVDYTRGHAQLRNSNTTGILNFEMGKCNFNQGIFIDIFPLDNIPDDDQKAFKLHKKVLFYRRMLSLTADYKVNTHKSRAKDILHILLTPFVNPDKTYKKLEKASKSYNNTECKRVSVVSTFPNEGKRLWTQKSEYENIIYMPFENITVPIPANYDKMLTDVYKDWRTPKHVNSSHGGVIFDTEKSYKEYLKK
ncbi:MAG: LicD family protein [Clostridiales bacterium]|nr:LicD family protein [Candidatus Equinaster intestinalis]